MCVRQGPKTAVMKQTRNSGLKPWKPGQSGNPLGRPQGARSKFSEQACADALADWTAHGESVLARVRATEPATYLRVLFSIIPKDVAISIEQRTGPLQSDEMRMLRRLVDMIETCAPTDAEKDVVFACLEEALRSQFAKQIEA
jgi:hypothetical protein